MIKRMSNIMKKEPYETNLINIERSFLLQIKISIDNMINATYAGENVVKSKSDITSISTLKIHSINAKMMV